MEREVNYFFPSQPSGSGPKVQAAVRLQCVLDRIKTEQSNLVRCLQISNSMLSQWSSVACKTVPLFSLFSRNSSDLSNKSFETLHEICSPLTRIAEAFSTAEQARIAYTDNFYPTVPLSPDFKGRVKSVSALSGVSGRETVGTNGTKSGSGSGPGSGLGPGSVSSSRSASGSNQRHGPGSTNVQGNVRSSSGSSSSSALSSISPLDSLSRGCMGEEVSNLINIIRMNLDDIKSLPQILDSFKNQQLEKNISGLKAFENAKFSVLQGSSQTELTLSKMQNLF